MERIIQITPAKYCGLNTLIALTNRGNLYYQYVDFKWRPITPPEFATERTSAK